jgi:DNA repair exonuclease SbcCD ATPase subunit
MTEEIIIKYIDLSKYFKNHCDSLGSLYCVEYKGDPLQLQTEIKSLEYNYTKYIDELKQENKSLYEEKNCLHKIIDRLLENAGYSKDIASAEDFEDVYEDMQIKRNELIELEQENKELKEYSQRMENQRENYYKEYNNYRSALEEIREIVKDLKQTKIPFCEIEEKIQTKVNEVLNESN